MQTDRPDPMTKYAAAIEAMGISSRRSVESTWRCWVKVCASEGIEPWPLTEKAVEACIRVWSARGYSRSTFLTRRWALSMLQSFETPNVKHPWLSLQTWASLSWEFGHARCESTDEGRVTLYELQRFLHALEEQDFYPLGPLLNLVQQTMVPLTDWLKAHKRDVVRGGLRIHRKTGDATIRLNPECRAVLLPLVSIGACDELLFSADGAHIPLSPSSLNRLLRRWASQLVGHPFNFRDVHRAALRFNVQLGVSPKHVAYVIGSSPRSVLRLVAEEVPSYWHTLMAEYGVPLRSDLPVFAEIYNAMRDARERFAGPRDRAIVYLLFFGRMSAAQICQMDRDDVDAESFRIHHASGLTLHLNDEQVLAALHRWISVRGKQSGALFFSRGPTGRQRITEPEIAEIIAYRSRELRCPWSADRLRAAGIRRAAHAGMPLAQLCDETDLPYSALADMLFLQQSKQTVDCVSRQVDALREARCNARQYQRLVEHELHHPYIHAGTA